MHFLLFIQQVCPTLHNPIDWSMPAFPVPHHLLGFAQVHVHWISDAIQPSHPLSPSSPFALNLPQLQGLFQSQLLASGGQSIGASASASVLSTSIQCWFPLRLTGLISLLSKGLSRIFSASLVAQTIKNLPAMRETPVWSLSWEDPLEKGMATHSSILAWRIAWTEELGQATVHGVEKSQIRLSN